ncbi:MAG TPA: DUF2845 domain-containing protein [Steroidobacteraceae bacterium]|jgi:hypothetical protein
MNRVAATLVLGLLASSPAFAALRCGNKIVTEGDTSAEVAAKCGEPTDVIQMRSIYRRPVIWIYGRPQYIGEDFIEVPVEAWVYNFGPNKLMRRLRFENGLVAEIETLGYGYN